MKNERISVFKLFLVVFRFVHFLANIFVSPFFSPNKDTNLTEVPVFLHPLCSFSYFLYWHFFLRENMKMTSVAQKWKSTDLEKRYIFPKVIEIRCSFLLEWCQFSTQHTYNHHSRMQHYLHFWNWTKGQRRPAVCFRKARPNFKRRNCITCSAVL